MKKLAAIALMIAMTLGTLTACSEAARVTHESEILDKRVVVEQGAQVKLGDIITAPGTYERYKFDLREEDGKIITKTVDKQDYYDYEIGDIYTYESRS